MGPVWSFPKAASAYMGNLKELQEGVAGSYRELRVGSVAGETQV